MTSQIFRLKHAQSVDLVPAHEQKMAHEEDATFSSLGTAKVWLI
jgi:hypothetical protein